MERAHQREIEGLGRYGEQLDMYSVLTKIFLPLSTGTRCSYSIPLIWMRTTGTLCSQRERFSGRLPLALQVKGKLFGWRSLVSLFEH